MAETRGDHAVKGNLDVSGNTKFNKGVDAPYLEIVDRKANGASGGTFNGQTPHVSSWRTRDLTNTLFNDFATSITLAASAGLGGDITLEAGVYYAEISCPAFNVNEHTARLADVTNDPGTAGETKITGTSEFSADTNLWRTYGGAAMEGFYPMAIASSGQTRSHVTGRFQLRSQRKLEVQHRCSNTQEVDGFGSDGGFYETNNVYTIVKMWQVRDDS